MKWTYFVLFLVLSLEISAQAIYTDYRKWEFSYDDQQTWVHQFPEEEGQFWLRTPLEISNALDTQVLYGIGISMLASSEIYWDGEYVGKNGTVGQNKSEEVPGNVAALFPLSDAQIAPGIHEVKIKFSNFHGGGKMRYYGILVTDFVQAIEQPIIATAFIHIYAGLFLIIGLFYGVRYIFDRRQLAPLLFGLLCLGFFALIITEYVRNYFHYPYPLHFTRLQIILGITIFISLMMSFFFMKRFALRLWWLLGVQVVFIVIFISLRGRGYDLSTNYTMILGFVVSSIILGIAVKQGKDDSWLLLACVLPLPFALYLGRAYYDTILYIGFGNLILINLISLAIQEQRNNREKLRIQGISERLKIDLLKKNIQPHFINNSLTSAIDWIERSPEKGVEFLFALSKEFDLLLDISEKKVIPIIKEIELCQAHLEIMSFRKEEPYRLEVVNVDEYDVIPPAVFLTIIENGISYQRSDGNGITFTLTSTSTENEKTYCIRVNGNSDPKQSISEGTGSKYIKARLTESYGNEWEFISRAIESGWETIIVVKKGSLLTSI